ncbi:MAG: FAD:protein FMN transferase [Pelistega sp.]|nr:FAD:protein FMN transferase [Pelistega sp.]
MKAISRRRFLSIAAASAGIGLVPAWYRQALAGVAQEPVIWQGIALGADAQLRIYHEDKQEAHRLVQRVLDEVTRLERIFSIYQEDSALSRLNAQGYLDQPPKELLQLLSRSHYFSQLSQGLFDPSVQVLWNLYAQSLAETKLQSGPNQAAIEQALKKVDYQKVSLSAERIELLVPGMQLTLNGIAQGYITDRVTELLRQAGLDRMLVNMGEIRGLDKLEKEAPWQVSIRSPFDDHALLARVALRNEAIATSAGSGTPLDAKGQITHLFNPSTGLGAPLYHSVSVIAEDATTADALSTAFSLMPLAQIKESLKALPGVQVYVLDQDQQFLKVV